MKYDYKVGDRVRVVRPRKVNEIHRGKEGRVDALGPPDLLSVKPEGWHEHVCFWPEEVVDANSSSLNDVVPSNPWDIWECHPNSLFQRDKENMRWIPIKVEDVIAKKNHGMQELCNRIASKRAHMEKHIERAPQPIIRNQIEGEVRLLNMILGDMKELTGIEPTDNPGYPVAFGYENIYPKRSP